MLQKLMIGAATVAILAALPAVAQTAQERNAQPKVMDRVKDAVETVTGSPLADLDTDMRHVVDALGKLGPKDLTTLQAAEARQQPSAADAAQQTLREQGMSTLPDASVMTKNILVDGAKEKIAATVYKPANASGTLPLVVYFHGGGFVIANNATYDATPRTMAKALNAVVVSVEYSKAPEHKFPASHDDAVAAYKWLTQNAASLGADGQKVMIAGESAGGNLTVNTAIAARDQNLTKPVGLLVVYPMAGTNLDTQSYQDNAKAKPLNKPMMDWFYKNLTNSPADMQDPRLDIVGKADLKNLPPTTVITAQIDPLQSEGVALAQKLKDAGVQVNHKDFAGVTHEFFGMGLVVAKAKEAEDVAVADAKKVLGQ